VALPEFLDADERFIIGYHKGQLLTDVAAVDVPYLYCLLTYELVEQERIAINNALKEGNA
jgi:hypothetical protein